LAGLISSLLVNRIFMRQVGLAASARPDTRYRQDSLHRANCATVLREKGMFKSIAPIWQNLRHLPRPKMFMRSSTDTQEITNGQHLAEQVAGGVGSWRFIGAQALIMVVWVLINALAITRIVHFDPFPFIFLNLALSAEAAFTGPILLIAANAGAARDHRQADRVEHLVAQNTQLEEQNEGLVEQLVNIERLIDQHVAQSLAGRATEIHAVYALTRELHRHLTNDAEIGADSLWPTERPGSASETGA
jgi:uncharacterized membrane protein